MDDGKLLTKQLEASLAIGSEQQESSLVLMPTMSLEQAEQRLKEFQRFVQFYMNEGEDYGTIPGTPKPTLYKSGADKLCDIYGLSDSYNIVAKTEDFDRGLFDYTVECVLTSRKTNQFVSSGLGCCSTWESKYRYRGGKRKCPTCGEAAIIKGKEEYGGGWLCYKKKGGCGAKFADNDKSITGQTEERVENPDIIDQKNTALKMAKKRAKIDGVLSATRSSGIFTQDMEDIKREDDVDSESGKRTEAEQREFAKKRIEEEKAKARPASKATSFDPDGFEKLGDIAKRVPLPKQESDGSTAPLKTVTVAQRKRMFAIANEHGVAKEVLRELLGKYGYEHSDEVTQKDYDAIVADIESVEVK